MPPSRDVAAYVSLSYRTDRVWLTASLHTTRSPPQRAMSVDAEGGCEVSAIYWTTLATASVRAAIPLSSAVKFTNFDATVRFL